MNPLSTWTYFGRHKPQAALLLSLSLVVTLALYAMVALVWGVFVEPGRLAYMTFSRISMATPWADQKGQEQGAVAEIRNHPDVSEVLSAKIIRIDLPAAVPGSSFQFDLLALASEDIPDVLSRFDSYIWDGDLPSPGTNELLLSAHVARMLDVGVGDTYDVVSVEFYRNVEGPLEPTPFTVVGILESEVELGIVSLEYLDGHRLYGQFPPRFIVIAHKNRDSAVDEFLRDEIQSIDTSVLTLTLLNERILAEALPGLVMLLPVVFVASVAFSLVIVFVNQIANAGRLPEFGILNGIGISRRRLVRRLTRETGTLAVIGWIIGIVLSWGSLYLIGIAFFEPQGHDLSYPIWMPIAFTLMVPPVIAGMTFVTVRRTLGRLDPVTIIERGQLGQEREQKRQKSVSQSSPKPLSPATFYIRHRRRALLLIGGMSVMILAVVLVVFALAIDADAKVPFLGYLRQVSIIRSPGGIGSLDPEVVAQVKRHPNVERAIPIAPRISMFHVYIPPFTSAEASPFAVYAEDMDYLVKLFGLELKEGHLPRPATNEVVIPDTLSMNRDLKIGDVIGDPNQPAYPGASSLPVKFVVSGIFYKPNAIGNENGWGFISLEFVEKNEFFPLPDVLPLIVVPREGQKEALDGWLVGELSGRDVSVLTHQGEVARIRQKARQDMVSIVLLEGVIALAAAIVLSVLIYVFTSQRQSEFGVLYALGQGRRQLVGRVLGETSFIIAGAWLLSAMAGMIVLLALRFGMYEPRGLSFDLLILTPWLYTLPIPVLVLLITTWSTARTLSKLDPISIIERRI